MKKTTLLLPAMLFGLISCNNPLQPGQLIEFDYIYTAEPIVSATNQNANVFKSVQEDFEIKYSQEIFQASIFVNKNVDVNVASKFLDQIESSVNAALTNKALFKTTIEAAIPDTNAQQFKFGVPGAMATKVAQNNNGFNLGYKDALTNKTKILNFVNLLTNNQFQDVSDDYFFLKQDVSEQIIDTSGLKVLSPTGAPAFAFYTLAGSSNFVTSSDPSKGVIPFFQNNTYDIIAAPTQGGMKQIVKMNANYKIAATITFGNFYLLKTGRDANETLSKGDRVCIFQQNDLPGQIFNLLYGDLELNITAVNGASDTKTVILNNGTVRL